MVPRFVRSTHRSHWVVSIVTDRRDNAGVNKLNLGRMSVDYALLLARGRAAKRVPFSPSWDAAIGLVEDLEREAYRLDEFMRSATLRLLRQPQAI